MDDETPLRICRGPSAALAVLRGALWLLTSGLIAHYLKEATVSGLVEYTVRSTVFAPSTATVWCFGDRASQPPVMKHR